MKKLIVIFWGLVLSGVLVSIQAVENQLPRSIETTQIEKNLFNGLASDNIGLQRSSALQLGSIQSESAVIPLMSVLHENSNENVRIAAAWALCRIGNPIGVFAVKRAVEYDKSEKVRLLCAWYYENLVKPGTFMFLEYNPSISLQAY